jgi:hypothetical protein
MLESHQARIEATLGTAMVLLKERAELCRQLVESGEGDQNVLGLMNDEALEKAAAIKKLLEEPWIQMQPPRLPGVNAPKRV